MVSAHVLVLLDFSKTFILETEASRNGIGSFLMQRITFISKALSNKKQLALTYEKKLLAILLAINHWEHYLIIVHFIIRTDHINLKNILEEKLTTSTLQAELTEMQLKF